MLLDPRQGVLFIVDVQARLAPAMTDPDAAIARMEILLAAAERLDVPIIASEQYPQGLGHTDERLTLPPATEVFAKTAFAASRDQAILAHLEKLDRRQVVLCGMETHVCVLQTALDLLARGFRPTVVADAVASRSPERKRLGLERMAAAGVAVVDSEMVVFEWLGVAGTPEFRELSRLIR
jgi:nicotinamidase-related amidase